MAKGDGFNNIFNNIIDKAMSSGVLNYFFGSRNQNNNMYGGLYSPYGFPPTQPEDNTTKYVLWAVLGVAFMFVFYMMFNNNKKL